MFSENVTSVIRRITNRLLRNGWDGAGNEGLDLLVVLVHPQAGLRKDEGNAGRITCPRVDLSAICGKTLAVGSWERLQSKGTFIFCPNQQGPEKVPLVGPSPAPPILPPSAVSQLSFS